MRQTDAHLLEKKDNLVDQKSCKRENGQSVPHSCKWAHYCITKVFEPKKKKLVK